MQAQLHGSERKLFMAVQNEKVFVREVGAQLKRIPIYQYVIYKQTHRIVRAKKTKSRGYERQL